MDEMTLKFLEGTRVKTPMGKGLVVGFLNKVKIEFLVSLDEKPVAVFEKGQNPVLIWSFDPKEMEVLENE